MKSNKVDMLDCPNGWIASGLQIEHVFKLLCSLIVASHKSLIITDPNPPRPPFFELLKDIHSGILHEAGSLRSREIFWQ